MPLLPTASAAISSRLAWKHVSCVTQTVLMVSEQPASYAGQSPAPCVATPTANAQTLVNSADTCTPPPDKPRTSHFRLRTAFRSLSQRRASLATGPSLPVPPPPNLLPLSSRFPLDLWPALPPSAPGA